jgi:hypothetical protein
LSFSELTLLRSDFHPAFTIVFIGRQSSTSVQKPLDRFQARAAEKNHARSRDKTANPQKNESSAFSGVTKAKGSACQSRSKRAADPEKSMNFRAIKALPGTVVALALLTTGIGTGIGTSAHAQTAAPAGSASMAKPPVAPSAPNANGARMYNPDNMPTKRAALPPNSDRMLHNNPASDAIAK